LRIAQRAGEAKYKAATEKFNKVKEAKETKHKELLALAMSEKNAKDAKHMGPRALVAPDKGAKVVKKANYEPPPCYGLVHELLESEG
jgi:hypothetical protein